MFSMKNWFKNRTSAIQLFIIDTFVTVQVLNFEVQNFGSITFVIIFQFSWIQLSQFNSYKFDLFYLLFSQVGYEFLSYEFSGQRISLCLLYMVEYVLVYSTDIVGYSLLPG